MEVNSIQNSEQQSFETKIKSFLDENERKNQDISLQVNEIASEITEVKAEAENNDKELASLLDRKRKTDSEKDKIIYKQSQLIGAVVKIKNELNRDYIKEYTELYNVAARKEQVLKLKVEELGEKIDKIKKESEEKIKKTKQKSWKVGIVAVLVSIAFTTLICYLMFGGNK